MILLKGKLKKLLKPKFTVLPSLRNEKKYNIKFRTIHKGFLTLLFHGLNTVRARHYKYNAVSMFSLSESKQFNSILTERK